MTNRVLLVDDLRTFTVPRAVTTARTSKDAVAILEQARTAGEAFDEVWLDHDLGDATGTNDTVMPVIDWLCEQAINGEQAPVGTLYVHTSNPVGANTMVRALTRHGYTARRVNATEHLGVDEALHAQALARTPELPATTEAPK